MKKFRQLEKEKRIQGGYVRWESDVNGTEETTKAFKKVNKAAKKAVAKVKALAYKEMHHSLMIYKEMYHSLRKCCQVRSHPAWYHVVQCYLSHGPVVGDSTGFPTGRLHLVRRVCGNPAGLKTKPVKGKC